MTGKFTNLILRLMGLYELAQAIQEEKKDYAPVS